MAFEAWGIAAASGLEKELCRGGGGGGHHSGLKKGKDGRDKKKAISGTDGSRI